MDKDLARAKEEAVSFEGRFRGKVAALAPKDLSQAVQEFENLLVLLGRVMSLCLPRLVHRHRGT